MKGIADPAGTQERRRKLLRLFIAGLMAITLLGVVGFVYVKTHPVVFNESFLGHAHCIAAAGSTLSLYANKHEGRFPFHTNGFGDALILLLRWTGDLNPYFITGANDDGRIFRNALVNGTDVREELCSRIYIQGLAQSNDGRIAILFDKRPS